LESTKSLSPLPSCCPLPNTRQACLLNQDADDVPFLLPSSSFLLLLSHQTLPHLFPLLYSRPKRHTNVPARLRPATEEEEEEVVEDEDEEEEKEEEEEQQQQQWQQQGGGNATCANSSTNVVLVVVVGGGGVDCPLAQEEGRERRQAILGPRSLESYQARAGGGREGGGGNGRGKGRGGRKGGTGGGREGGADTWTMY
jgi:hypothetical protein